MSRTRKERLVPYEMVSPGFEAVYTGEKAPAPFEKPEVSGPIVRFTDGSGNIISKWSVWTWSFPQGATDRLPDRWPSEGEEWGDPEIRHINRMQVELGRLSDEARQVRAHIGSFSPCDSGFPVTVDELLDAIGRGRLGQPPFHNGCWMGGMWWDSRSTQPLQGESMQVIREVLTWYLAGKPGEELTARFPQARGFVNRTYEWLGPVTALSKLQRLMMERVLLPFEYFSGRNQDPEAVIRNCFDEGGRGAQIDGEISALAGLPRIYPDYLREYRESLDAITDPEKRELYRVCCHISHGVHGLSDCHHSTFRYFEKWIHGVGKGRFIVPGRRSGSERERLGRLLLGYTLGLDKWLLSVPMQFLLLDLGHMDLGFDPRNEVLRVYAYLGGGPERTPVKEWLAACLWYNLTHNRHGGLTRHKELLERAVQAGVNTREWMDSVLKNG